MKKYDILIYNDLGVDKKGLIHTIDFINKNTNQNIYNIKTVDSSYIIKENWEDITKLFIMPGGADIPYFKKLKGKGCDKISDFVRNGGSYLGICAGSYFACKRIEFAKGTDIEVLEDRDLCFFNGTISGPILKEYVYNSQKGACITNIKFINNIIFKSYYNGGGTFIIIDKNSSDNVKILGTYHDKNNLPAIIKVKFDKGNVILSGPHIEFPTSCSKINEISKAILKELITVE